MGKSLSLFLFVFFVWAGGALLGLLLSPHGWYETLNRPFYSPPDWVFAPVWSVLYVMIGVVGARTWRQDRAGSAMKLWVLQLLLNYAWTPVFFGLHHMGWALVVVILLLISIGGFMGCVRTTDRISAWLFVPYFLWVSFAVALNAGFLINNP